MLEALYLEEEIQEAVRQLASTLNVKVYHPCYWVVLNGAFMFAADLLRLCKGTGAVRFLTVNRGYSVLGKPHEPKIFYTDPPEFLAKYTHVFVDVVAEEGETFKTLLRYIPPKQRAKTVALVVKGDKYLPDFYGFNAPKDLFLTGYGMSPYRHLSYIATMRRQT